jgi:RsmE family RNA methyltransferase
MNILIFKPEELTAGRAEIDGRRLRHIREVIKCSAGSLVRAGVLNGNLGTAEVESIDEKKAVLRFTEESAAPAAMPLRLAIALPRPKVLRRVLYAVTCLGVKHVHVFNSWRVEKSYWGSPLLSGLDHHLVPALEQAKDTIMPSISFHRFFTPFIREELPTLSEGSTRLLAHPSDKPFTKPAGRITLAVGPEGGFIQKELDTFAETGFETFSAGERILNVETAVPFILGKIL